MIHPARRPGHAPAARRLGRLAAVIALLTASACQTAPSIDAGSLTVDLVDDPDRGSVVRLAGLSSAELAAVERASLAVEQWRQILRVTVGGDDGTAVEGRYGVGRDAIEFVAAFRFDPGRAYDVRVDPLRLPQPRDEPILEARVARPGVDPGPPTSVAAIYPSAHVWPENLLRFYVHFSRPMARTSGVGRVRLVDEAGAVVTEALLPLEADFWDRDATRYTVFFDPGRVKRGIRPNLEMGRALVAGRRYAIVVDADWADAAGRPLAASYRHDFEAGPAVEEALATEDWHITAPEAGSSDPLVVRFPWALDHALMQRAIGVGRPGEDPMPGEVVVASAETEWRFTPPEPWETGQHELVVLSVLEDPAGNRPGRAFEAGDTSAPPVPERSTVAFDVD